MSHLMNTYARQPITFDHGEGVWLWDTDGKRYLDAVAGVAVNALGHAHPKLVKAIAEQAGKLMHTSNLYQIDRQEQLGDRLAQLSGMDKVFFCNSGAEANEAAIKLARLHGHAKGIDVPAVIVMEKSFHGRTMATLTATGSRKVQAGFEPLVSGFVRVPYNDVASVALIAEHNRNVAAVLVEPVQGEGGVNIPSPTYLQELRELCDKHGWLLMLDEVQTGIGRCGTWFACQLAGVMPDVMTLAKGLGAGFPIGACLAKGAAAELFKPGNHGSTFGGNPLACAAALTVLDVVAEDSLGDNAVKMGALIRSEMVGKLDGVKGFVEARNQGLLIGIELDRPCGELVKLALAEGLLINVTADNVVRLLPPLVISHAEAGQLVEILSRLIKDFLANSGS
ncbi:MAG: acetylornithine transaminase [Sulfuricella sp.]|nr:acetylornithine transaminase [Sulfuricella sp.]